MDQLRMVASAQVESVYSVVFRTAADGARKYEILNISGERKPQAEIAQDLRELAKKIWFELDD